MTHGLTLRVPHDVRLRVHRDRDLAVPRGWPAAEETDDADGPWDHRRRFPADPLPLFPHPDLLLVDALKRPLAKMPTPMDSAINRTDGTPSTVTWRPPAASDASAVIAARVTAATARQSAVSAHHIARVG
ncbi:hypothetical protein ACH4O1_03795 [Streptomyces lydicus]|uniref:hypothetical protein n=1 Tax=Streptomyces lydicus TaxID=47763 RepID=UPI0037920124